MTSLAENQPAAEDVSTTLVEDQSVQDDFVTSLATEQPAAEDVSTTLVEDQPAQEDIKTTFADQKPVIPADEKDAASAPKPSVSAGNRSKTKRAIAIIVILAVAAIIITVVVNLFGKPHELSKEEIDEQCKDMFEAARSYLENELDVSGWFTDHYGSYECFYDSNDPDLISAQPVVVDGEYTAQLGKTTVGDFKKTLNAEVEEKSYVSGNAFEIKLTRDSSARSFTVYTKPFSDSHSEVDYNDCIINEILIQDEDEGITPFRYQDITEASDLKEITAHLGTPDMIRVYAHANNKAKEATGVIKLEYKSAGDFRLDIYLNFEKGDPMTFDSASIGCVHFYFEDSGESEAETEADDAAFSVDDDADSARALEKMVAFLQSQVDLGGYQLYQDEDTGKHYSSSYDELSATEHFYTHYKKTFRLDYDDYPESAVIDGTEITLGKTTPQDLLDQGWEEYTKFSELENKEYSPIFYMKSKKGNLVYMELEPTAGISPKKARLAGVNLWTGRGKTFQYLGVNEEDDFTSVRQKLSFPSQYSLRSGGRHNVIYLEYDLTDNIEVSIGFRYYPVNGELEMYSFYMIDRYYYKSKPN